MREEIMMIAAAPVIQVLTWARIPAIKVSDSDSGSDDSSSDSRGDTTTTAEIVDSGSGSVSYDTQTQQDIGDNEDTGKEDSNTTLGAPNGGIGIDNGGDILLINQVFHSNRSNL
jgi:hypothetical protein